MLRAMPVELGRRGRVMPRWEAASLCKTWVERDLAHIEEHVENGEEGGLKQCSSRGSVVGLPQWENESGSKPT